MLIFALAKNKLGGGLKTEINKSVDLSEILVFKVPYPTCSGRKFL
jgi:hypothetical protein